MKRAVIAILLHLLLGMLTAVAVAWGIVLADLEFQRDYEIVAGENGWDALVETRPGQTEVVGLGVEKNRAWGYDLIDVRSSINGRLPAWSVMRRRSPGEETLLREGVAGLPMPCLRFVGEVDSWKWDLEWDTDYRGGILALPFWRDATKDPSVNVALPFTPMALGLAANTAVFGSLWLVLPLMHWGRLRLRSVALRMANRCTRCSYDRRAHGSGRCPECGAPPSWNPEVVSRGVLFRAVLAIGVLGSALLGTAVWFACTGPQPALHYAAYKGDEERVRRLLGGGAEVDVWSEVPAFGHVLLEPRYIEMGSVPPRQGITPLMLAALAGDAETVRLLVSAGADIDASDTLSRTPLHFAADGANLATIDELVSSGADVNAGAPRMTPLLLAACDRNVEVMEHLEDLGAAVNEDEEAFAMAARLGPAEACEVFFRSGAEITATVLLRAARSGDMEWLDMFVQHGADLLGRRENGETLLFWLPYASESRPVWEHLVEAGIDVNARDDRGRTALFAAGTVEHLQFLLEHGADPTIRNMNGETAADCAWTDKACELLRRAEEEWEKSGSPGTGDDEDGQ